MTEQIIEQRAKTLFTSMYTGTVLGPWDQEREVTKDHWRRLATELMQQERADGWVLLPSEPTTRVRPGEPGFMEQQLRVIGERVVVERDEALMKLRDSIARELEIERELTVARERWRVLVGAVAAAWHGNVVPGHDGEDEMVLWAIKLIKQHGD